MNINNINIVFAVTGSISAYKSPLLIREFIKRNSNVFVLQSESAKNFVTKLTLQNLSRNQVIDNMFAENIQNNGSWHIHLAQKCDLFIIAPATANTIGKLANGLFDDVITTFTCALDNEVKKVICPAMDSVMWENLILQHNLEKLKQCGYYVMDPEVGELASGINGKGRLPEINNILSYLKQI